LWRLDVRTELLKAFSFGIAAGFTVAFAAIASVFGAVGVLWPERLPPPAISSLAVIDEKLRFLRGRPELDPQILAVGSSITWRQLSGEEFARNGRFLNAGMVKLKAHHTAAMAEFFLDRYRSVGELVTLVSLPDFEDCSDAALMFDPDDALRYAFDGWPSSYFYLRYFDLQRYVRTARTLVEKRVPMSGELYIDDYGSGPIQISRELDLGLRYHDIYPDPHCTASLVALAAKAAARDVDVMIVFSPIHPDYRALHPVSMQAMAQLVEDVRTAATPYGAKVLSLFDDPRFTARDFYDAFHLQWDAVDDLSRVVANTLQYRVSAIEAE
jgi:hypothetical protein